MIDADAMQNTPLRVLFYVQHLLGIGHVKRASLLVQGWLAAGLDVTVVSGGEPVPQFRFDGARLLQLAPVKARDANFSALVNSEGQPLDAAFKQGRTRQLLDALQQTQPHLLVIENYPFGRRQLRWELLPLLQSAVLLAQPPRIVCSIRDILQARKPERVDETVALIDQYFDAVLVHGDSHFIPLQQSFPRCQAFTDKLRYTGYVTDPAAKQPQATVNEILISAGGGAVGFALMRACLEALAQPGLFGRCESQLFHDQQGSGQPGYCWRFLLGPNVTVEQQQRLNVLLEAIDKNRVNVILEPVRPDFPELLQRCRLSISQGGYNTLMDLLAAECAAVVVPFEGSGETEQLARTERLQQLGLCRMVREAALTPTELARAVCQLLDGSDKHPSVPQPLTLDCNGAALSAQILKSLVDTDA
ncbi:MAG: glycosyltransferase [Motiliproteus sp.]